MSDSITEPTPFRTYALDVMRNHGFEVSRMIAYSRRVYLSRRPNNQALFNANVVTDQGKIWFGDLDLTDDSEKLQDAANELRTDLYILREEDYRFNTNNRPMKEVKKLAVKKFVYKEKQEKESITQRLLSLATKTAKFFSMSGK